MLDILVGAFVVSTVHALMPDHWIPLVLISRAEGWSQRETMWISAIVTIPHMISTILLGMAIGLIGFQLSTTFELIMERIAPVIFILIGGFYIYKGLKSKEHHHHGDHAAYEGLEGKPKKSIISFLATALFFSPCVPIGSYFLVASPAGTTGLIAVSAIYLAVTLAVMLAMIYLGRKGIDRVRWSFLEHNENMITGAILVILGLFVYLVEI
jgi:putative Mn2+ efflux pump MntP